LAPLLFESAAVKILHAGRQDLELFTVLFDRVPAPLFDTQAAAALLGLAPQVGYAALAETLLGVTPGVALGRYDWLARPLSEQALDYAAEDVANLEPMREILAARLKAEGRTVQFNETMREAAEAERYRPHPEEAWKRIRASRRLDEAALARLQSLAGWREQQAMKEDRPRQWILRDRALVVLARVAPRSGSELARIKLLRAADRRRYGSELLELLS
ncbi:MAG: HRDC domain-containing protein, partial [Gammaproteobacteria bacterium]